MLRNLSELFPPRLGSRSTQKHINLGAAVAFNFFFFAPSRSSLWISLTEQSSSSSSSQWFCFSPPGSDCNLASDHSLPLFSSVGIFTNFTPLLLHFFFENATTQFFITQTFRNSPVSWNAKRENSSTYNRVFFFLLLTLHFPLVCEWTSSCSSTSN